MSDTDDTDVLLLIPPDFFFVAPSPSPASSILSISPPPIPRSFFKRERISQTERRARNSLKELNSQLRHIDKRLSLIESQRNCSMDGENSRTWYDLERMFPSVQSLASANHSYQPHASANNSTDWRSMNVQELLQASGKDSKSYNNQRFGLMTHSWGPSDKEFHMSSSQHNRELTQGRETVHQNRGSGDNEDQMRERKATSLPPTPSSHHAYCSRLPTHIKDKVSSGFGNESEKQDRSGTTKENLQRTKINTERPGMDNSFDGKEVIESSGPENKSDWLKGTSKLDEYLRKGQTREGDRLEKIYEPGGQKDFSLEQRQLDDQSASLGGNGAESFNLNSSSLDGTLGVSALLPSLSSVGLSASLIHPTSLDITKESSGSVEGGVLTLAQVEKLLHDMRKTQAEMEISIRRGMENLGKEEKGLTRQQNLNPQLGAERQANVPESSINQEKLMNPVPEIGKGKKDEMFSRKEEKWITEGKVDGAHSVPSMPPVRIEVENTEVANKKQFAEGEDETSQEHGVKISRDPIEGQPCRDVCSMYRSKSDESLSGKRGKHAGGNYSHRYLGIDSGDDSFISSGPLTASQVNRLGDTIGSVPDLGLGVREMFANSGKQKEAVKEPPFVKRKMSLLGSANPKCVDSVAGVAIDNSLSKMRSTDHEMIIEKTKFDCSPTRRVDGTWPLRHPNKVSNYIDHSSIGEGKQSKYPSSVHSPVTAKHVSYYSPQKEFPASQNPQNLRNNPKSDARRQLNFDDELMHLNHPSVNALVSRVETIKSSIKDGTGIQSRFNSDGNSREEIELRTGIQISQKDKLSSMGPVVVVGGEGLQKGRKHSKEKMNWERERYRKQDDNMKQDVQPRNVAWNEVTIGRGHDQEGIELIGEVQSKRPHNGDREGARLTIIDHEPKSLDSGLGREKELRFKDSGYDSRKRNLFRGPPLPEECSLFSSSDVWIPPLASNVEEAAALSERVLILRRKLEEERFRREHCERVIEEVGRRALEAQERLAVSNGLSKAKDVALGKFREAWEEAVCGWKREGEAKKTLEAEMERYRERVTSEIEYRDKRLKQLECEVVRFADEICILREELRKGQRETTDITTRFSAMLEVANKEAATCRKESESACLRESRAQEDALKTKDAAKEMKKKLEEAIKKADSLECEKVVMKQEMDTMQGKLKDDTCRISNLEIRLADAEIAADKAHQSEKSLREELNLAQQEWEKERIKLKEFYQLQVEELVRTKVSEFQGQLDSVEQSLKREAELREEEAKKLGEERLRLLNDKHSQEVNLLEQKHEEELALWSLRLKRALAEVDCLKSQVSKYNSQKSQLAKRLHALMQAQLKQGLRLIASGGEMDSDPVQTPPKRTEKTSLENSWRELLSSLNVPESSEVVPVKDNGSKKEMDYLREKAFQSKEKMDMNPSSSRTKMVSNSDLKKYIHMLLGREPGRPVDAPDLNSESEEEMEIQRANSKHSRQFMTKEIINTLDVSNECKMDVREKKRSRKLKSKVTENEDLCKLSKDIPVASWEPIPFKLCQPESTGNILPSDPNGQENRRSRKPPWK